MKKLCEEQTTSVQICSPGPMEHGHELGTSRLLRTGSQFFILTTEKVQCTSIAQQKDALFVQVFLFHWLKIYMYIFLILWLRVQFRCQLNMCYDRCLVITESQIKREGRRPREQHDRGQFYKKSHIGKKKGVCAELK